MSAENGKIMQNVEPAVETAATETAATETVVVAPAPATDEVESKSVAGEDIVIVAVPASSDSTPAGTQVPTPASSEADPEPTEQPTEVKATEENTSVPSVATPPVAPAASDSYKVPSVESVHGDDDNEDCGKSVPAVVGRNKGPESELVEAHSTNVAVDDNKGVNKGKQAMEEVTLPIHATSQCDTRRIHPQVPIKSAQPQPGKTRNEVNFSIPGGMRPEEDSQSPVRTATAPGTAAFGRVESQVVFALPDPAGLPVGVKLFQVGDEIVPVRMMVPVMHPSGVQGLVRITDEKAAQTAVQLAELKQQGQSFGGLEVDHEQSAPQVFGHPHVHPSVFLNRGLPVSSSPAPRFFPNGFSQFRPQASTPAPMGVPLFASGAGIMGTGHNQSGIMVEERFPRSTSAMIIIPNDENDDDDNDNGFGYGPGSFTGPGFNFSIGVGFGMPNQDAPQPDHTQVQQPFTTQGDSYPCPPSIGRPILAPAGGSGTPANGIRVPRQRQPSDGGFNIVPTQATTHDGGINIVTHDGGFNVREEWDPQPDVVIVEPRSPVQSVASSTASSCSHSISDGSSISEVVSPVPQSARKRANAARLANARSPPPPSKPYVEECGYEYLCSCGCGRPAAANPNPPAVYPPTPFPETYAKHDWNQSLAYPFEEMARTVARTAGDMSQDLSRAHRAVIRSNDQINHVNTELLYEMKSQREEMRSQRLTIESLVRTVQDQSWTIRDQAREATFRANRRPDQPTNNYERVETIIQNYAPKRDDFDDGYYRGERDRVRVHRRPVARYSSRDDW